MTKTQAVREIMEKAKAPLSPMDIQKAIECLYNMLILDSTITRRLREWDAHCERDKFGVHRYSLRKPQQPNLF